MKKTVLSFVFVFCSLSVYSQSSSQYEIAQSTNSQSYALLDLGFEAKLLHLNTRNHSTPIVVEQVKKSPRSLEDIMGKSKKTAKLKYHLIAGCFSSENNANRLVSQLNKEGFDSERIGRNEQGLYMVTYRTYDSETSALKVLNHLATQGKSSWLRIQ